MLQRIKGGNSMTNRNVSLYFLRGIAKTVIGEADARRLVSNSNSLIYLNYH